MKTKLLDTFRKYPFFVWLLPIFFVLHGYTEFYNIIPFNDSLKLGGIYLISTLLLYAVGWLLFRNHLKTAFFVFSLMAFNFFFGPVHDFLKTATHNNFLSRYTFILPAVLILFITFFIVLKKTRKNYNTISLYLNILFLIFLTIDGIKLITKKGVTSEHGITAQNFLLCADCNKPDVYLILTDGYAGKEELNDLFKFDNSLFENELKKRGFYIVQNTKGNYNFTRFVMASMLNMNYINGVTGSNTNPHDIRICNELINDAAIISFFKQIGYEVYNYSIFDMPGQPSPAKPTFLPRKTKPIISQTFLYRIQKDLWYHLVTDLNLESIKNTVAYHDLKNNNKLYELTLKTLSQQSKKPKFIYTHFMMPHFPYYFDSTGKEMPYESLEHSGNKENYISYLKYCNKKLLTLTDRILENSSTPPLIVLMGDHGFREFKDSVEKKYYFMNHNSVLLPSRNYSGFYSGMSNINQFRVILNTEFRQNLPLLKDSTSFINE